MANVNLRTWEAHNLEVIEGQLCVRRAFASHVAATSIQASSVFCGGFSLESPNTGEVQHYLFLQSTTTRQVTLYVTDEELTTLYTYPVGLCPQNPVITHAVQNDQVLINSPHFKQPLYGIVGGGVKVAEKVASVNPNTTAIDIPLGPCCTFADRIVIANGSNLYINDPGVEIRTFVAENAVYVPGTIYDIFQADQGLYVFTSDGVYVMPPDAISQGQLAVPFVAKVAAYQAFGLRNAAVSNSRVQALGKRGLVDVAKDTTTPLTTFGTKRTLTRVVGVSPTGDYRYGSIFPTTTGFAISINQKIACVDVHNQAVSWLYGTIPDDVTVVGILRNRDGEDLILTPSRLLQLWGTYDYNSGIPVDGVAAGSLGTPPEASPVVRFITTMSNNVGLLQQCALRNLPTSQTTPAPSNAHNVIGTDTWGNGFGYTGAEDRSRRHAFAVRTDDVAVEIGAQGAGATLKVADVQFRGQGANRP